MAQGEGSHSPGRRAGEARRARRSGEKARKHDSEIGPGENRLRRYENSGPDGKEDCNGRNVRAAARGGAEKNGGGPTSQTHCCRFGKGQNGPGHGCNQGKGGSGRPNPAGTTEQGHSHGAPRGRRQTSEAKVDGCNKPSLQEINGRVQ